MAASPAPCLFYRLFYHINNPQCAGPAVDGDGAAAVVDDNLLKILILPDFRLDRLNRAVFHVVVDNHDSGQINVVGAFQLILHHLAEHLFQSAAILPG